MSQTIRWILILPGAIAAWFAALVIAIALYQGLEALCPSDQMESGHCFAPWFSTASEVLIAFGAALAAALVMITCTLLAPAHKRQVAIATFAVGTIVAIIMGWKSDFAAMMAAIVVGNVILAILHRRLAPFSRLAPRWSARVEHKVPSPICRGRSAQLNRSA